MASLLIQGGDGTRRRVPLDKELTSIGRSRESDVFLADQWLSRHHAEVRRRGDGFFLIDLGSKNGTLLNTAPLTTERRLRDGDVITLGEHTLTFADELAEEAVAEGEADDQEPVGTKVFSAVELSQVVHRPAADSAELQRQNRLLAVLAEAGASLIAHRPLPELFEHILNLLFEAVPAERGAILLLEGQPPAPAIKASRTRQGGPITRLSRSIARHVLEERVSLLLPNLMEDAAFSGQDSIMASGISSALCAPLWYTSPGEGKDAVIGLVYLDTRNLTQAFGEEDLKVVTVLANVAAAKIENARLLEESLEKRRLEEDMRIAADIQRRLLPESAPQLDGWGLVGSNRPCRAIGGDYFDFALESGRLLLALGDVSGKGTGAALLMTVLRAAVRAHWTHEDLAVAVSRINRTVYQNIPQGKYITFFVARLDPATGALVYVNAGHNPPLLQRSDGRLETLTEGGVVLGLFESASYQRGSAQLEPGDTLVVFSDGVTETWNPDDEEFGEEGLGRVLAGSLGQDAPAVETAILRELEAFEAGGGATDDRTLLVLKREAGAQA